MPVNGGAPWSSSVGPCDVNVQFLCGRANAPNHLTGPKRVAQQSDPAILRLAYGAERIFVIAGLISVQAVSRKLIFQSGVPALNGPSGARAKRLALKSLKELLQLGFARLREDQTAFRGFPKTDVVKVTKFTNALQI